VGLADVYAAMAYGGQHPKMNYSNAVRELDRALKVSRSGQGSMTFTPTEEAEVLCTRGRIKAMLFDADTPGLFASRNLTSAREDLRKALTLNSNLYEADLAADKIDAFVRQSRRAIARLTRAAPVVIFVVALTVGALVLAGVLAKTPAVEKLSGTNLVTLALGVLVLAIAGISLPNLSKVKAGGVELEITPAERSATRLGITRTAAAIQLDLGFGPDGFQPPIHGHRWSETGGSVDTIAQFNGIEQFNGSASDRTP
jgi:hypothetical protein